MGVTLWAASAHLPLSTPSQVQSLKAKATHAAGFGERAGRGEAQREEGIGGGGDPLREAFNRLGSVIDFQGKQQVRV